MPPPATAGRAPDPNGERRPVRGIAFRSAAPDGPDLSARQALLRLSHNILYEPFATVAISPDGKRYKDYLKRARFNP